jgi:hypothetical protein
MLRILVTSGFFLALAGCGQTGPLRLPAGTTPTPPAATVPAPLPPGAQQPPTENPAGTGKDPTTR